MIDITIATRSKEDADARGGDDDGDHYYLWNGDVSDGDDDGDSSGVPYDIDDTNHKWGVYKNNEVTFSQYSVQIINNSWPILYQI